MTYGITHNLVQTKLYQLSIEKKDRRKSLYRFVDNVLSDSQSCLNTLQGQALSGDSTHTDRSFEITALKDANNGKLMDFSKTNGILDDAATKEKLKNLGIDKFESLKFRYKTALPRTGQVVLTSKTEVKGLHEKSNRELIWEISGLKVETKTNNGTSSEQVTLCQDSVPLKILCGDNVTGTGHLNGGGFVQSTATVDSGAYVSDTAVVCGNAKVKGNARVFGNAQVTGNAEIKGNALVYDNAKVSGNAVISGDARVFDSAKVDGAKIYGNAQIFGMAKVEGNGIEIYGNAKVLDNVKIYGSAKIYGNARIEDSARVQDSAKVFGNALAEDNATIGGDSKLYGSARVSDSGSMGGTAKVFDNARVRQFARVVENAIVEDYAQIGDNAWAAENSWIKDRGSVAGTAWVQGKDPNDRATVGGNVYTTHGVHNNCKCVMKKDTRYGCGNVIMTRSCGYTYGDPSKNREICGERNVPYLPQRYKKGPSSAEMNIRNNREKIPNTNTNLWHYTGDRDNNGHFIHSGGRGYYRNGCTSNPTLP